MNPQATPSPSERLYPDPFPEPRTYPSQWDVTVLLSADADNTTSLQEKDKE